jgi:hypothetical protein
MDFLERADAARVELNTLRGTLAAIELGNEQLADNIEISEQATFE